jgi:transposase
MRINKTDRNDARGLAELVRMGWYREAKVKSMESRQMRAVLAARAKLVDVRRDIENQMRGLLKSLGIVLGKAGSRTLRGKIVAVLRQAPHLRPLIDPMMVVHSAMASQILKYDAQVRALAKADPTVRRLMTVPGVGPVTALAYVSTIDDPKRFAHACDVGAYLGLTPRRHQSGELDRTGRISKRGDRLMRSYLFEAANVLLTVVLRPHRSRHGGSSWSGALEPRRQKSRLRASSPSSSIASGPMVPSSSGERPIYETMIHHRFRFGGRGVPAGTRVSAISKFVPAGNAPRSSHRDASPLNTIMWREPRPRKEP